MFENKSFIYDPLCTSPMEQMAKIHCEIREFLEKHPYKDVEDFMKTIACIIQDYIKSIDLKMNEFREHILKLEKMMITFSEEDQEIIIGGIPNG